MRCDSFDAATDQRTHRTTNERMSEGVRGNARRLQLSSHTRVSRARLRIGAVCDGVTRRLIAHSHYCYCCCHVASQSHSNRPTRSNDHRYCITLHSSQHSVPLHHPNTNTNTPLCAHSSHHVIASAATKLAQTMSRCRTDSSHQLNHRPAAD